MALLDAGFDRLKYEIQEESRKGARIKVVGVGGGGSNAVARMMQEGLDGVEFYVMNTDVQALASSPVPNKLQIGTKITNGLGAGSDPGSRPAGRARRHRAHHRNAGRRRHGVRHRRTGRRHRHGRGAGGGVAGQGTGRAHRRGGHQAVRVRRRAPHAPGREEPGRTGGHRRHASSPFPTTGCSNSCRAAPASSTRSASPTTFCARPCRASATSSPRPA